MRTAGTGVKRSTGKGVFGDDRGAVAVEFILVFGIVVGLLLTTLDAGRLLHHNFILLMAAREGARRAAIAGGDYPEVREHIYALVEAGRLSRQHLTLNIQPRRARYGTTVVVNLEYPFQPQVPLLATILGPEVRVSARMVTRSERLAPRD